MTSRVQTLSAHFTAAAAAAAAAAAPAEEQVLYQVHDGVGVITLNRPSRGNAYTPKMQLGYAAALKRANADNAVLAIVVTGAGKMFCVGADKDWLSGPASEVGMQDVDSKDLAQVLALELNKPVICAVNGPCAGLGFVTALMADVRFASPAAKFTTSFAKRGLVAEHGISWVLPKVVGMSRAMDLLLSSRVVPASEAKEMGLVNFVSEGDCLADAVQYARQCGKLCSPAAMAEIKRQVYSVPPTFRQDSEQANELMRRSFAHEDFKEGVASLVQARDPRFAGLRGGLIRDLGKR